MYGSISRASMAAMWVALQYPWSKAPALGVPKAGGMASKVGRASAGSLGWLDRVVATRKAVERPRLVGRSCNLAGTEGACGVAITQQTSKNVRRDGLTTAWTIVGIGAPRSSCVTTSAMKRAKWSGGRHSRHVTVELRVASSSGGLNFLLRRQVYDASQPAVKEFSPTGC